MHFAKQYKELLQNLIATNTVTSVEYIILFNVLASTKATNVNKSANFLKRKSISRNTTHPQSWYLNQIQ